MTDCQTVSLVMSLGEVEVEGDRLWVTHHRPSHDLSSTLCSSFLALTTTPTTSSSSDAVESLACQNMDKYAMWWGRAPPPRPRPASQSIGCRRSRKTCVVVYRNRWLDVCTGCKVSVRWGANVSALAAECWGEVVIRAEVTVTIALIVLGGCVLGQLMRAVDASSFKRRAIRTQ